jgi:hypothetical protein
LAKIEIIPDDHAVFFQDDSGENTKTEKEGEKK